MPLHAIAEQDTTDLEKCLDSVEAPLFLGLGFLGGRIDHHLAAMNALVRHAGQADGPDRRRGPVLSLPAASSSSTLAAGHAGVAVSDGAGARAWSREGLRWSVDGLAMAPDGAHRHLEHRARRARCGSASTRRGVLVILPVALLGEVVARLAPGLADDR